MTCKNVGDANGGVAGIGVICAFAIQAGLSVFFALWACILILQYRSNFSQRSPKIINKMLVLGSNIQVMTGIALLVAGIISQHDSMDLYHQHVLYDTVGFTGISYSAAVLGISIAQFASRHLGSERSTERISHATKRSRISIALKFLISRSSLNMTFTIFYLIFIIRFGRALRKWDDNLPGQCYHFDKVASPVSRHPQVDELYLGLTASSTLVVLIIGIPSRILGHIISAPGYIKTHLGAMIILSILFIFFASIFITFLQYPLHLYMIIKLREANPHNAGNGGSEDKWDFGQVVALVAILPVIQQCIAGYLEREG